VRQRIKPVYSSEYLNHKLMILGAGVYQVPLILRAKELGLQTIVVSRAGKYPGIDLADTFVEIDTTDVSNILSTAEKYNIDGILTTGTDVAIPAIGAVVERLGLHGPRLKAAICSTNKCCMKKTFIDYDIPTAPYTVVSDAKSLSKAADQIGLPLMIKAPDSSGSRGIHKVDTIEQLEKFWIKSRTVSSSDEIILEAYLEGYEIGADVLVVEDEIIDIFLHNRNIAEPPNNAPIGHSMPVHLSTPTGVIVKNVIRKAVKALGIENTFTNCDIMIVDNEPYIIEMGARMGGTCLPETISTHCGIDIYEIMIRLALGLSISLPKKYLGKPVASLVLRSSKTGVISNITVPETLINHPQLVRFALDKGIGDTVKKFEIGPDRIGEIIVTHSNASKAETLAKDLLEMVNISVSEF
jgi:biotin carboxylase